MKPDDRADFEKLMKLLALKGRERPDSTYFEHLSTTVVDRLKHDYSPSRSWWHRMRVDLELKPVLAGLFGLAVLGFLSVNLIISNNGTSPSDDRLSRRTASMDETGNGIGTEPQTSEPAWSWESHLLRGGRITVKPSLAPETGPEGMFAAPTLRVESASIDQ